MGFSGILLNRTVGRPLVTHDQANVRRGGDHSAEKVELGNCLWGGSFRARKNLERDTVNINENSPILVVVQAKTKFFGRFFSASSSPAKHRRIFSANFFSQSQ